MPDPDPYAPFDRCGWTIESIADYQPNKARVRLRRRVDDEVWTYFMWGAEFSAVNRLTDAEFTQYLDATMPDWREAAPE